MLSSPQLNENIVENEQSDVRELLFHEEDVSFEMDYSSSFYSFHVHPKGSTQVYYLQEGRRW
jgi:hypothetical protein